MGLNYNLYYSITQKQVITAQVVSAAIYIIFKLASCTLAPGLKVVVDEKSQKLGYKFLEVRYNRELTPTNAVRSGTMILGKTVSALLLTSDTSSSSLNPCRATNWYGCLNSCKPCQIKLKYFNIN